MIPQAILSSFILSPEDKEHLSNYYLLKWSTHYFLSRLSNGTIEHSCTPFIVIYHKNNPHEALLSTQLALSFRKPKDSAYGYVIVKSWKDS